MKLNATVIVLFAMATSCFVLSSILMTQMIGEINRKLPDNEQIPYWGFYGDKYGRIRREYKRLYPRGRIHLAMSAFWVAGGVFLLLTAVASGFLRAALRNAGW